MPDNGGYVNSAGGVKGLGAGQAMRATHTALVIFLLPWFAPRALAMDSFEDGVTGWHATGGKVACSGQHWKDGRRSLRWDFTPGGTLVRNADAATEAALTSRDGGIKLWLYCEKAVPGALSFHVGPWEFSVNLGFTGWRAIWVEFRDDARAFAPVAGMQILAPETAGSVFLDAVELGPVPWFRQGDAQAPYTNAGRANGRYWFTTHDHSAVPPPSPSRQVSDEDRRAFRELEGRCEQWMFGRLDDPRPPVRTRLDSIQQHIEWGRSAFDRLGIERRGGIAVGPGAFCELDSLKPHLAGDVFQEIALALAYDARLNDSDEARRRFVDLTDYAYDQGWASGSLMGTGYGGELRIAGYVHAVYILRDLLKREGRLARELETLRYQLSMGAVYRAPDHPGASADDLRTLLLFRLLYVLMLEDSPEKVRDMECLVRWADAALSVAPGYAGTLKPDGTVFHHAAAYASAYGNDALLMSSLTYWLLAGTRFAISADAGANIRHALLTLRFMAGQYHVPMGVSGRWPFSGPVMVEDAPAFAYMADALGDAELGAAFARLWDLRVPAVQRSFPSCGARIYWCDTPGASPWLLDAAARYKPEPHPRGHRACPFAAMNFHRRRQWVASVRGWSRYVWNYEDMAGENRYGRYSSYGMLQIFSKGEPVNPGDSGYREEGWDWLRPPGATVIRVPVDSLPTLEAGLRPRTKDTFVGGVALSGSDGLWAMRFADPCYDPSFRFRKSVFFVDETIVCLGSGISNCDTGHPTETVLYQTALAARPGMFPDSRSERVPWLVDPIGNGYFFPEPQIVETRARSQASIDNGGRRKTEGDFAVGWIDHGCAPRGAGYAYAIRPDTTEGDLKRYAVAPDFSVLRRDDDAHIVRFPGKDVVGYVLFAACRGLEFDVLRGVDGPCLIMTRRDGNRLVIAVADPDLRFDEAATPDDPMASRPGAVGRLRLHLNGSWRVVSGPRSHSAIDSRTFEIECRDGAGCELVLEKR